MRLLNSEEIDLQPADMTFGPSKIKAVIMLVLVVGVFGIPLVLTFKSSQWVPFAFIAVIAAVFLMGIGSFTVKAFSKNGWKIAAQTGGILLKANITGKNSDDILEIEFSDIASLGGLCEQYYVYKQKKNRTYFHRVRCRSLDFELTNEAFSKLRELTGSSVIGLSLTDPNRLIYPSDQAMLLTNNIIKHLERHCKIRPEQQVEYDKPDLKDPQQANDYILLLAQRGHKMDAQRMARRAFGLGLGESKQYVVDLLQQA